MSGGSPPEPHRLCGFLPWRLSDAGPQARSLHQLARPASETLHRSGSSAAESDWLFFGGRSINRQLGVCRRRLQLGGASQRWVASTHLDPERAPDLHPNERWIEQVVEAAWRQRRLGSLAFHAAGRAVDMRQLVNKGPRDQAGRIGILKQPRRERDIFLPRDPGEGGIRIGVEADIDGRVPPDGGEVPDDRAG